MTRCLLLAIATLAGAIAALFWAFVKVGGDFRERPLPLDERVAWLQARADFKRAEFERTADLRGEAGW